MLRCHLLFSCRGCFWCTQFLCVRELSLHCGAALHEVMTMLHCLSYGRLSWELLRVPSLLTQAAVTAGSEGWPDARLG